MSEITSGGRQLALTKLASRASKAAAGLRTLGVGEGDTIALCLRNDFAIFEASFATKLLGAYPVAVNWHYTESEARYIFANSNAKVVIIHADLVGQFRAAIPADMPVLVVTTPPELREAYGVPPSCCLVPPRMTDWDTWRDSHVPLPAGNIDVPGTIVYTSGTTGHPKGVRREPPTPAQAKLWMDACAHGFGFTEFLDRPERIVTVITGPMYHSAPNTFGFVAARAGARIILEPRFDAERLLGLIESFRVTHLHMVPVMFNRLLKLPAVVRNKYDLSSLRYVVHGAAPCPPITKRQMIEWWGPIISEYYGSTETGLVTMCSSDEWLEHTGTVGRPLPHVDVRVIGPAGDELAPGEVGEIVCCIRGIADFTYHRDDCKRQAMNRGGFVALGDIGYLDSDGFLFLCDRAIDMIISGGVNIYSSEVEAALHQVPGVADCAVFGIPDEEFGESVHAVVQCQPDATISEGVIGKYLRERLAGFKLPKSIEFSDRLPREESGKIFKRKLRDPFWQGLGRRI
jgi:long-chain acyl-CoA synthetase